MINGSKCKPFTEEHKRKISEAKSGIRLSEEHKRKISEGTKGRIFSEEHKRRIGESRSGERHPLYGKHLSIEYKRKISESMKGNKNHFFGKHHTEESKQKMSELRIGMFAGEKNPAWLGGISFKPYSMDWTKKLKASIRKRDNYTCGLCGAIQVKNKFDVHHIDYDKKNCNTNNLITLCVNCHRKTYFNREQWKEFFDRSGKYKCLLS